MCDQFLSIICPVSLRTLLVLSRDAPIILLIMRLCDGWTDLSTVDSQVLILLV